MVALRLVAPGTPLREGLDRILQAKHGRADRRRRRARGALHLLGRLPARRRVHARSGCRSWPRWTARSSSPSDASRIARANVHLVPDPNVPTSETGTRHRTAERVGRQIDVPVITVSEDMSRRRGLPPAARSTRSSRSRACSPGPTRRCRSSSATRPASTRVSGSLSALEVEDLVTVRDVVTVLQRAEMVRRIAEEIEGYVVELGADGRLVLLQLEELMGGVEDDRRLVRQGLLPSSRRAASSTTCIDRARRARRPTTCSTCARSRGVLHLAADVGLDSALQPRGYRLLHKIPRLPEIVVRPRRRPLRQPAEDHAGEHRRPRRGRGRGRGAGPGDQGRPRPAGRDARSSTATS